MAIPVTHYTNIHPRPHVPLHVVVSPAAHLDGFDVVTLDIDVAQTGESIHSIALYMDPEQAGGVFEELASSVLLRLIEELRRLGTDTILLEERTTELMDLVRTAFELTGEFTGKAGR